LKAVNATTTIPVSEMPIDQTRDTYTYATIVSGKPDLSGTEVIEKTIKEASA